MRIASIYAGSRTGLCGAILRLLLAVAIAVGAGTGGAQASWPDGVRGATFLQKDFWWQGSQSRDGLSDALDAIARRKAEPPALLLAAVTTAEGHWTFVNQAGQRYTAANEQELGRVYKVLAPADLKVRPGPVVIYVAGESVFAFSEHLSALPGDARLRIVVGGETYPLRAWGRGKARTWFAEVRANVFVRAANREGFVETARQLARRLKMGAMRVLALDRGAPDTFRPKAVRKVNGVTRQAIDAINPDKLAEALPTLRRQTALITGRLGRDGELVYRTSTGIENTLRLAPVRAAAARSDTNLIIVNASAPRQPGVRNWLWLRAEVDGLVDALQQKTLGDFFNVLAGGSNRLFVEARTIAGDEQDRVRLSVVPMRAGVLERTPDTISVVLSELVSEVTGSVVPHAVDADMVAMRRQDELDLRLVPGISSVLQYGFAVAVAVGLIGLPVALGWWRRIWTPEVRTEYPNRIGYETARAVRWVVFALLFLPLAGAPAVIWGILRAIRWVLGGRRGREEADAGAATG